MKLKVLQPKNCNFKRLASLMKNNKTKKHVAKKMKEKNKILDWNKNRVQKNNRNQKSNRKMPKNKKNI